MDYQLLNKALNNIDVLRNGRLFKKVAEDKVVNCDSGGNQGETDIITEVYEIGDKFLKLVFHTDSYGESEYLYSIQICGKTTKSIEVYEAINS